MGITSLFLFYYALEKLLIKVNPIWPVGLIPNQLKLHKNNWADTGKIRQAEKAIIKERKKQMNQHRKCHQSFHYMKRIV